MILLLALVRAYAGIWRWIPGLLLFGTGVGTMLTSSVNVVQSSFPDKDQGDISGLSRSVSNLGSSFGTALVGSVPQEKPAIFPASQPGPQDHHPQRRRLRLKRWAARYRSLVRLAPIFSAGGSGRGP